MRHEQISADAPASDAMRAQLLLNGHIARIDAALSQLRLAKDRMVPSIADMHGDKLHRLRRAIIGDLDNVLNAPLGAGAYIRRWNHNAFGPNVDSACEAVDAAIARLGKPSYHAIRAARWGGLEVVR